LNLRSRPTRALLRFSADTRYKLLVNGTRIAVGPARGSPLIWYYDSLDITQHLKEGHNEVCFVVIRYFAASRGGMPFERTALPGLTVIGDVEADGQSMSLDSCEGWLAEVDNTTTYPMGRPDDVFLHVSLEVSSSRGRRRLTYSRSTRSLSPGRRQELSNRSPTISQRATESCPRGACDRVKYLFQSRPVSA
jgi:hypothetical protein